jgi:hypothetical protein
MPRLMSTPKQMRKTGKMRGLSLSYRSPAQKLARLGVVFGVGVARLAVGFHPRFIRCALSNARIGEPRSYDPSPQARIAPIACSPCPFFCFLAEQIRSALSFADVTACCGISFSRAVFFGRVKVSATQQRADKSCANHFLQSPLSLLQPLLAVWTMTQNVQSQAALRGRLLRTQLGATPQRVLLRAPQPARCVMTRAFAAKTVTLILALGARIRVQGLHEKQGFRADPLGSLFSCA